MNAFVLATAGAEEKARRRRNAGPAERKALPSACCHFLPNVNPHLSAGLMSVLPPGAVLFTFPLVSVATESGTFLRLSATRKKEEFLPFLTFFAASPTSSTMRSDTQGVLANTPPPPPPFPPGSGSVTAAAQLCARASVPQPFSSYYCHAPPAPLSSIPFLICVPTPSVAFFCCLFSALALDLSSAIDD